MDERAGTTLPDVSGLGHPGAIVGPVWIDGRFGGGLWFDGIDDHVETAATALDGLVNMTLAVWVNPTRSDSYRRLIDNDYDCQGYESIALFLGSFVVNSANTDITRQVVLFTPPPAGVWTHIAATFDGAYERVFLDGVEVASAVATAPPRNAPFAVWLGDEQNACSTSCLDCPFVGVMDEVRVYNRALSDHEISSLAATAP